ncbi:MAG: hypothetical protein JO321_07290 [Solirubrobacterales bacterium]|nr:hypothetical protein [Solirubrobacterales bacterium]MBV9535197.1 hypothetical protein [Solirubrobacterales bacterium]
MAVIARRTSSERSPHQAKYAFGPAVRLEVEGSRLARSHFAAEFGPQLADDVMEPDLKVIVRLASHPRLPGASVTGGGGYKTARWRLALSDPDSRPLRAVLGLFGAPASFALSLVQGYVVEPLVAIALARAGFIALPSAGVAGEDGAILLMGRSGSGKSSVCMRLVARGVAVLSDDQIVLDRRGGCWPYPRRFRVYPDLRETATAAWTTLPPRARRALALRRAASRLTRGYVAPSLAVSPAVLGAVAIRGPVAACRLVVIQRDPAVAQLTARERHADWLLFEARASLLEQRAHLAALVGTSWREAINAAVEAELSTFRAAASAVSVTEVVLPQGWNAPRAIAALDDYLVGLGAGRSAAARRATGTKQAEQSHLRGHDAKPQVPDGTRLPARFSPRWRRPGSA